MTASSFHPPPRPPSPPHGRLTAPWGLPGVCLSIETHVSDAQAERTMEITHLYSICIVTHVTCSGSRGTTSGAVFPKLQRTEQAVAFLLKTFCGIKHILSRWIFLLTRQQRKVWTHWDLNPGPSACEADVIPLHHEPMLSQSQPHVNQAFARGEEGAKNHVCVVRVTVPRPRQTATAL